ncbi:acyltransferase domain-containing protein [Streptomyces sp. M19]
MGRALYERFPAFAAALDAVCGHLDAHLPRPLLPVLFGDDEHTEHAKNAENPEHADTTSAADADLLHRTQYTQAGLFALQVALFRLLEEHGVARTPSSATPSAGSPPPTSPGARPARRRRAGRRARTADAVRPLRRRHGRRPGDGGGGGTVPGAVPGAVRRRPQQPRLDRGVGDADAVDAVVARFREQGRKTTALKVSHAFHSAHMEPVLEEFRQVAAGLTYREPTLTVISDVTGRPAAPGDLTDPEYWVRHIRRPVRFLDGVRSLEAHGVTAYVELGPDPVLTSLARQNVEAPRTAAFAATLRKGHPEAVTLLAALAALRPRPPRRLGRLPPGRPAAPVADLPTYAFQRDRFWLTGTGGADVAAAGLAAPGHPLLGASVDLADTDQLVLSGRISPAGHPGSPTTPWPVRSCCPAPPSSTSRCTRPSAPGRPPWKTSPSRRRWPFPPTAPSSSRSPSAPRTRPGGAPSASTPARTRRARRRTRTLDPARRGHPHRRTRRPAAPRTRRPGRRPAPPGSTSTGSTPPGRPRLRLRPRLPGPARAVARSGRHPARRSGPAGGHRPGRTRPAPGAAGRRTPPAPGHRPDRRRGGGRRPPAAHPFAWSGVALHATGATTLRVRVTPVPRAPTT